MSNTRIKNWRDVQSEVLHRINSRTWKPGELIPNEADLAEEFGCARATVNRALQAIADAGLLDRKRKAGTRVATHPVRKATLDIPVIRQEIEGQDKAYSYALITSKVVRPPAGARKTMKLDVGAEALHLRALHLADGEPYVYEDRWINLDLIPAALKVDFQTTNANEWLVANEPFTRGDFAFSALNADKTIAGILNTEVGEALFSLDRSTWRDGKNITCVRLVFAPGYKMRTSI